VSLLPVTDENLPLLQTGVGPEAWPQLQPVTAVNVVPLPDGLSPIKATPSPHADRRELLSNCCEIFISLEAELNALDAQSGDGDTGSTLATAARAMKTSVDELPLADMTQLYRAISTQLSQTMGGSSGVLLAIFFAAAGDASASGHDLSGALTAGLDRIRQVGGAKLGDRTMIDALEPALAALPSGLENSAVIMIRGLRPSQDYLRG